MACVACAKLRAMARRACECADRLCPVHTGQGRCLARATVTLFRVDMVDRTGTRFCAPCADDAAGSSLFTDAGA
jgi:hypothetical protein